MTNRVFIIYHLSGGKVVRRSGKRFYFTYQKVNRGILRVQSNPTTGKKVAAVIQFSDAVRQLLRNFEDIDYVGY